MLHEIALYGGWGVAVAVGIYAYGQSAAVSEVEAEVDKAFHALAIEASKSTIYRHALAKIINRRVEVPKPSERDMVKFATDAFEAARAIDFDLIRK